MTTQSRIYFFLAFIFALIILIMASCNGGAINVKDVKSDTVIVLGEIVLPGKDNVSPAEIHRVTQTILIADTNDIKKNKVVFDSSYIIPVYAFVKDSATGKLILDPTGKVSVSIAWYRIPKGEVWDSGIKLDTAKRSQLMKKVTKPYGQPDSVFLFVNGEKYREANKIKSDSTK